MKPDGLNLWYFKLRLFDLTEFNVYDIGLQIDKGIRMSEFKEKTQFLCENLHFLKTISLHCNCKIKDDLVYLKGL